MSYRHYNANPLENNVSDCTVRAISTAEGKTWDETYEELSRLAQINGILLDDVDFIEDYLDKRYLRQCHYSKTIEEFIEEYSKGTYLITMKGHITCVKNGVLIDTFDCRDRRMWCAWYVPEKP